ncbi:uncharacterized protein E0L32_008810 [Thyridium curvatum]|uniref:Uncharacterized protein n=1 Tax=Thyridium curvatum TaxID=1093900 RepID=A0A507AQA5_9PEZI|nr:uncharacterized protein E0L32_008810 [Thyridium curvatum]TPX09963.1 hypothetical protein E0L32_008810 [Thyridium curvatum]
MARLQGSQRRSNAPNEHVYALGERGRKTGVTLKDTGVRDEYGMQPIDDIFSSPEKGGNDSDDGEADMDLTTASGPDPATLINGQNGNRLPIPRARSPIKTFLQSPAIRNPAGSSSPNRENDPGQMKAVNRRLNFGAEARHLPRPMANGARTNGASSRFSENRSEDEDDEEEILHGNQGSAAAADGDDSMQMLDAPGDYDEPDAEPEEEQDEDEDAPPHEEAEPASEEDEAPIKPTKRRGRPAKSRAVPEDSEDVSEPAPKRRKPGRSSLNEDQEAQNEATLPKPQGVEMQSKGRGRGRKPAKLAAPGTADEGESSSRQADAPPKAKRGRKRKSSNVGDESVVITRGPPLPKARGLVISRREVPGEAGMVRTRSGRNSFKPLAFWRNEHVEFDQSEVLEDRFGRGKGTSRFVLPAIKEVHRVEEEVAPHKAKSSRRRPAASGGASKRRRAAGDDDGEGDEPAEPWEEDPGEVVGEVVVWRAEHEANPPSLDDELEVTDEQVALSSAAVQTRDVRNGDFRFAKTLSTPYFGAGVVDMPPGSLKRPKNSRKMHMTFFVFTGRVQVTVNETQFRISKGGMWFVPRGQ